MTGNAGEEKIRPRLDDLVKHLEAYSRRDLPSPPESGAGRDLVRESEARGFDVQEEEEEWLADEVIWPHGTTSALLQLMELCESLGIPYDIKFRHISDRAPARMDCVAFHLTGD